MKDLLRIAVVWNIPVACNRASADFMISSTLMTDEYQRLIPDYQPYQRRFATEAAEVDEPETVSSSEAVVILDTPAADIELVEPIFSDEEPDGEAGLSPLDAGHAETALSTAG